jgi:hypothetical protein
MLIKILYFKNSWELYESSINPRNCFKDPNMQQQILYQKKDIIIENAEKKR